MKKFVSIMNHVLTAEQLEQAKNFKGESLEVIEVKGPIVDPNASKDAVYEVAKEYLSQLPEDTHYVHVMSDFGFTVAVVTLLQTGIYGDIIPIYATTHRVVNEVTNPDGSVTKTTLFKHVQFREY